MITKVPPPRSLPPRPITPPPAVPGTSRRPVEVARINNGPSGADAPSTINNGAQTSRFTERRSTATLLCGELYAFVKEGNLTSVQTTLDAGADPNARHMEQEPPLLVALASECQSWEDIASALLTAGADANVACKKEGATPLLKAVQRRSPALVAQLLSIPGVSVHRADKHGQSAYRYANRYAAGVAGKEVLKLIELHDQMHTHPKASEWVRAASAGRLEVLKQLHAEHGDSIVSSIGSASYPALWGATEYGRIEAVKLLVGWGADMAFRDPNGVSIIDLARTYHGQELIAILEAHQAGKQVAS